MSSKQLLICLGFEVEGVFMKNWDERNEKGVCPSEADYRDVQWVCQQIGIPCRQIEFIHDYWNEVFRWVWSYDIIVFYLQYSEFICGYDEGITPNADVLCNEKIKFGIFHRHVIGAMKMDAMATGHYAQLEQADDGSKIEHLYNQNNLCSCQVIAKY